MCVMFRMSLLRLRSALIIAVAITVALASGCSRDPEVAKKAYLESGHQYVEQKKYDAAIIEYRNAVQQDPRFGEARFRLAETYLQVGDGHNALREAVRAADLLPERTDAQLRAATLLIFAGQFADARARAQGVLQRDPKNAQALVTLGNALAGLKDLDRAVAQIEEAIRMDPERSEVYANLGALQAVRGDLVAAEQAFLEAVARDEKSMPARLALAQFYWIGGRSADAEQTLKETRAIDPRHVGANRMTAAFYESIGKGNLAEQYLKTAAEADERTTGRLVLAEYYIAHRRSAEAVPLLRSLTSDSEIGSTAKVRLAAIDQQAGRIDEANKAIDELLIVESRNVQALLVKAGILLHQKKLDEALIRADAAVASDPGFASAQYARGRVLVAKNRPEEAKQAFNEALRLNPRAAAAQVELARLHLDGGATDTSVALAGGAVRTDPTNADAQLVLARGLMMRRDLIEAAAILNGLVAALPNAAVVHAQVGLLHTLKNEPQPAAKAFERALTLDPLQLDAIGGLGALDVKAGRVAEARSRIETLVAGAPRNAGLLLVGARTFHMTKNPTRAEALLVQAIAADPATLSAYSMLGQLYLAEGRLDAARREFERLAERQTRPVAALTMVGIIQQMQGNSVGARGTFERVLRIDSHAAVAANNLAWIYTESGGSLDIALQLAQTAKAMLPEEPEVDDTLGWVYYRKELLPLAIKSLQLSVQRRPDSSTFQFHLGLAYAKSGDKIRAKRAMETALRLKPDFDGADEANRILTTL